ncbi:MAG TPA: hypothetical protein DCY27_04445 [Desulfobacterales bacterium]|nr:hypothetical protein [Desulfobacterales bacterium]
MLLSLTPKILLCSRWRPCWPRQGQKVVRLSNSGTFPISHPSTRLCLELMVAACQEQQPASLLDLGCGSGVLALAGALLGIPLILGCDISGRALRTSRRNAQRNRLTTGVCWLHGSTEALKPGFHLIVVNLPFVVQMEKQEELLRLADFRGGLILSGFRDSQEGLVADFYFEQGWRLSQRLTRDRWEPEPPVELSYTWVGLYLVADDAGR